MKCVYDVRALSSIKATYAVVYAENTFGFAAYPSFSGSKVDSTVGVMVGLCVIDRDGKLGFALS
jgi:hypothetical protein